MSSTSTMGCRTASGNFGLPAICPPVVLRSREFNSDRGPPRRPTAIWDTIMLSRLEMTADVVGECTPRCAPHPHMSRGRMPSAGAAHPPGLHFLYFTWDSIITVQFTDGPLRDPIWDQTLASRASRTRTAIYNGHTIPGACPPDPANMSDLYLPGCRPGCHQPAPACPTALFDPPAFQRSVSQHDYLLCYLLCCRQAPNWFAYSYNYYILTWVHDGA